VCIYCRNVEESAETFVCYGGLRDVYYRDVFDETSLLSIAIAYKYHVHFSDEYELTTLLSLKCPPARSSQLETLNLT
jgi:hypothetical protein